MSSDGPQTRDSWFWHDCTVRFTCLKVIHMSMYGRRVSEHLLCQLVSKGLYGVVHWRTDFTIVAIAVHAFHEVGAAWKRDPAAPSKIHP